MCVSVYASKLAMLTSVSPGTGAADPSPTANRKISQKHRVTEASNLHGNQPSAVVNRYCFYSQDFATVVSLSTGKGFDQECLFKKTPHSHSSVHALLLNLHLYLCCLFICPPLN